MKVKETPSGSEADLSRRFPWRNSWTAALALTVMIFAVVAFLLTRKRADADLIWREAQASVMAGRYSQARTLLDQLRQLRPPTPQDFMLSGQVAFAEHEDQKALDELAAVDESHPMGPRARLLAGQIELRRHHAQAAEHCFREAIRLDPSLVSARRELIYILGYQLRRRELCNQFEALSQYTDLTFDNVFHWCLLRTAQWEPASAIAELTRFIEADPEDRWSRLALAENYRRSGLIREARELLAPLADDDPEALACRVMLHFDSHEESEAERLLNSAPAKHPSLANLRGHLALSRRDSESAIREFRLAQTNEPANREAVFGLMNALIHRGDDRAAEPLRRRARLIDELNSLIEQAATPSGRTNIRLLRNLGAAHESLGRPSEARAWYKLALGLEPLDPEAQHALFRLQGYSQKNVGPHRDDL